MALDKKYFARQNGLSDHESLPDYVARLPKARSPAESHFLSHVLYEHARNFVGRFPWFARRSCRYEFKEATAAWIETNVQCEYDRSMWDHQYELPATHPAGRLPALMKQAKTWPTVPVIFEITDAVLHRQEYCLPLFPHHLIEGTRRMNFFRLMLADGTVSSESRHVLLKLTPG
jgi:hypothetical protein